jgi:ribosomal protein L11 methyltransferase
LADARTPALDLRWNAGLDAAAFCELLHAALDDFAPIAVHEDEAGDEWRVFFKDRDARDRAAASLAAAFPTELTRIHPDDVADEEWARRSQAHLRSVRAGRVVVAPPWDVPAAAEDVIVVVIDPSTGFGTGHHETTRLCLRLLQDVGLDGARVIDVGTGSGVLAIAAARLGAREAIALDEDPDALANAAANVVMNGVEHAVAIERADLADFHAAPADVVTANLTGAVLQRHAERLRALVAPGGALIASGFTVDESAAVIAAFGAAVDRTASEGAWMAVRFNLPETRS